MYIYIYIYIIAFQMHLYFDCFYISSKKKLGFALPHPARTSAKGNPCCIFRLQKRATIIWLKSTLSQMVESTKQSYAKQSSFQPALKQTEASTNGRLSSSQHCTHVQEKTVLNLVVSFLFCSEITLSNWSPPKQEQDKAIMLE